MDVRKWNYCIEEVEMGLIVKVFIKNVIIRVQQKHYIKKKKGYIFGGDASINWTYEGNYQFASECFIFTLTNLYNTQPSKFSTQIQNKEFIIN